MKSRVLTLVFVVASALVAVGHGMAPEDAGALAHVHELGESLVSLTEEGDVGTEAQDSLQAEIDKEVQAEEDAEQAASEPQHEKAIIGDSQMAEAEQMLAEQNKETQAAAQEKASIQSEIDKEIAAEEKREAPPEANTDDLSLEMSMLREDLEKETGKSAKEVSEEHLQLAAEKDAQDAKSISVERARVHLDAAIKAVKQSKLQLTQAKRDADKTEKVADERETKAQAAAIEREKDSAGVVQAEETAQAQVESITPEMQRLIEQLHDAKEKARDLATEDDAAKQKEQKDEAETAAEVGAKQAEEKSEEEEADALETRYGSTLAKVQEDLQAAQKAAIRSRAMAAMTKAAAADDEASVEASQAKEIAAADASKTTQEKVSSEKAALEIQQSQIDATTQEAAHAAKTAKTTLQDAVAQQSAMLEKDAANEVGDQQKLRSAEAELQTTDDQRDNIIKSQEGESGAAQAALIKARQMEVSASSEADEVASRLANITAQEGIANSSLHHLEGADDNEQKVDAAQKAHDSAMMAISDIRAQKTTEMEHLHRVQASLQSELEKAHQTKAQLREKILKDQQLVDAAKAMEMKKHKLRSEDGVLQHLAKQASDVAQNLQSTHAAEVDRQKLVSNQDQEILEHQQGLLRLYQERMAGMQGKVDAATQDVDHLREALSAALEEVSELQDRVKENTSNPAKTEALQSIQLEASNQATNAQRNLDQALVAQKLLVAQQRDLSHLLQITRNETTALEHESQVREAAEARRLESLSLKEEEAQQKAEDANEAAARADEQIREIQEAEANPSNSSGLLTPAAAHAGSGNAALLGKVKELRVTLQRYKGMEDKAEMELDALLSTPGTAEEDMHDGLLGVQAVQKEMQQALQRNANDAEIAQLQQRIAQATSHVKDLSDDTGSASRAADGYEAIQAAQQSVQSAINRNATDEEIQSLLLDVQQATTQVTNLQSDSPSVPIEKVRQVRAELETVRAQVKSTTMELAHTQQQANLGVLAVSSMRGEGNGTSAYQKARRAFLKGYQSATSAILQQVHLLNQMPDSEEKDTMRTDLLSAVVDLRSEVSESGTIDEDALANAVSTAEEAAAQDDKAAVHAAQAADASFEETYQENAGEQDLVSHFVRELIYRNQGNFNATTLQLMDAVQRIARDRAKLSQADASVQQAMDSLDKNENGITTANKTYADALSSATARAALALHRYNAALEEAASESAPVRLQLAISAQRKRTAWLEQQEDEKEAQLKQVKEANEAKTANASLPIFALEEKIKRHNQKKQQLAAAAQQAVQELSHLQSMHKDLASDLSAEQRASNEKNAASSKAHSALSSAIEQAKMAKERWTEATQEDEKAAQMAMDAVKYAEDRSEEAKNNLRLAEAQINGTQQTLSSEKHEVSEETSWLKALGNLVNDVKNQLSAVTVAKHGLFEARGAGSALQKRLAAAKYDVTQAKQAFAHEKTDGDLKKTSFHGKTVNAQQRLATAKDTLRQLQLQPPAKTDWAKKIIRREIERATKQIEHAEGVLASDQETEKRIRKQVQQAQLSAEQKMNATEQHLHILQSKVKPASATISTAEAAVETAEREKILSEHALDIQEQKLQERVSSAKLQDLIANVQQLKIKMSSAKANAKEGASKLHEKRAAHDAAQDAVARVEKQSFEVQQAQNRVRVMRGMLALLRQQASHAQAALLSATERKRRADILAEQSKISNQAKTDKSIAIARHRLLTTAREARGAETQLEYAVARATSAEQSVQHLSSALDAATQKFEREHGARYDRQEWLDLVRATHHNHALQQIITAMQDPDKIKDAEKANLMKAFIAEYRTNGTYVVQKMKLQSLKSQLAALKQEQLSKKGEAEAELQQQQLAVAREKAEHTALEANARRALHTSSVVSATAKSLQATVASIGNLMLKQKALESEGHKKVTFAQAAYDEVVRQYELVQSEKSQNQTESFNVTSLDVGAATMKLDAAKKELEHTHGALDASIVAVVSDHGAQAASVGAQKRQAVANLTEAVSHLESSLRHTEREVAHSKQAEADATGKAAEMNEELEAAVRATNLADQAAASAALHVEDVQGQAAETRAEEASDDQEVKRQTTTLAAAKEVLQANQKVQSMNKKSLADLDGRVAVIDAAEELAAEAHAEAESQYDIATSLLAPLLDVNHTANATTKHPQAQLKAMVRAAQGVVSKVTTLKDKATQARFIAQTHAAAASATMAEDRSEYQAATTANNHAGNVERSALDAVASLNTELDDAMSQWTRSKRASYLAKATSHVVSVKDRLNLAREAVGELQREVSGEPAPTGPPEDLPPPPVSAVGPPPASEDSTLDVESPVEELQSLPEDMNGPPEEEMPAPQPEEMSAPQ